MVMQEIYILTKHANFPAKYVEDLPTWKRRYYIDLLEKEVDEIKKQQENQNRKAKMQSSMRR
jgi:phage terminase Nu1 subunit (DNA packaging protein)